MLNSVFCEVQVQNFLIYLYSQHHDIYGIWTHLCLLEVCIIDIFVYIYGLYCEVS